MQCQSFWNVLLLRNMTNLIYGSATDSRLSDKSSYYIKNGRNECEFDFSISKIFQDDQY
jgi:hypothetical protein